MITTGPVLLIEEVAMTANVEAEPRLTGAWPVPVVVPVVKFHGLGTAPEINALPKRSVAAVEMLAVYCVLGARFTEGVNVAI